MPAVRLHGDVFDTQQPGHLRWNDQGVAGVVAASAPPWIDPFTGLSPSRSVT